MDKEYDKQIIIAKIEDKIKMCRRKNSFEFTDFLDMNQKSIVLDVLKNNKFNNYIINNDEDKFDRDILVLYPDKMSKQMAIDYYNKILAVIKIENPKYLNYEHRIYLSAMMKLGIKREKFGDICVSENGANIIIFKELSEYIIQELKNLKRFQKSKIYIADIDKLEKRNIKFEDLIIIVSSLRLDSIVSGVVKCSRTNAKQLIEEEKVFINSKNEYKISKMINLNDIIKNKGKGKFLLEKLESKTRKENLKIIVKKYC